MRSSDHRVSILHAASVSMPKAATAQLTYEPAEVDADGPLNRHNWGPLITQAIGCLG